jgi:hypothetical protein
VNNVKEFNKLNLHEKLELLDKSIGTDKEVSSGSYEAIGLGNAFQRAINAMHNSEAKVARIVGWRVITLLED